jgi:hypothetical protein
VVLYFKMCDEAVVAFPMNSLVGNLRRRGLACM